MGMLAPDPQSHMTIFGMDHGCHTSLFLLLPGAENPSYATGHGCTGQCPAQQWLARRQGSFTPDRRGTSYGAGFGVKAWRRTEVPCRAGSGVKERLGLQTDARMVS